MEYLIGGNVVGTTYLIPLRHRRLFNYSSVHVNIEGQCIHRLQGKECPHAQNLPNLNQATKFQESVVSVIEMQWGVFSRLVQCPIYGYCIALE